MPEPTKCAICGEPVKSAISLLQSKLAEKDDVEPVAWIDEDDCIVIPLDRSYSFVSKGRAIPNKWAALYTREETK